MSYHIVRWRYGYNYPYGWDYLSNVSSWKSHINNLKNKINNRYDSVVKNLQKNFKLSNEEYQKYFGSL